MEHDIYLDSNATTPVLASAAAAAQHAMRELFGNPSSTHSTGLQAREMMCTVRSRASRLLGAGSGELAFVSGATEAIQTAVLSALHAVRERRLRGEVAGELLVYGTTEHKAVPESLAHWNRVLGLELELRALPVDRHGRHDLEVLRVLAPRAALVCTMAANNETGCVSDLAAIERVLAHAGGPTLWLVDCVQALGKLPLNLAATRIDYAAFSGHKLYAPKGIGLLYVRKGAPFTPLMAGGGQEQGLRSGTENMSGIAALGAILEALEEGRSFHSPGALHALRARLVASLQATWPDVVFNAPLEHSLPTTLNFSVPHVSGKELLDVFDAAGIRVSAGSACSAAKAAPSFVLEAMGLPAWQAASAVRMSFGPATDEALITRACAAIEACGHALRGNPEAAGATAGAPEDGLMQWTSDGESCWLLADPSARRCVVIDPLPALEARLTSYIIRHGYDVRAVLDTGRSAAGTDACSDLRRRLGAHLLTSGQRGESLGWPTDCATLALADGRRAEAFAIGPMMLARLAGPHSDSYLLGRAEGGHMNAESVRFAFVGTLVAVESDGHPALPEKPRLGDLPSVIGADTLLCCASDARGHLASSLQAEQQTGIAAGGSADMDLSRAALADFLSRHADAVLVDVRERHEQRVGPAPLLPGCDSMQLPLSELVGRVDALMRGARRPLVFVCRSGNRSSRAAQCLRRLGYQQAWTLSGGLALAQGAPARP